MTDSPDEFARLLRQGGLALKDGNRQLAHDLWREAAMIDPYNEQIWLALLEVLDSVDDRRVCLQNIVAINPKNTQARRMLRLYEAEEERASQRRQRTQVEQEMRRRRRRRLIRRALLTGVLLGVSAIIIAIALSILVYGPA